MNFTAIDVETANSDMASICQIGIARFTNGVVVDEWKSYIDPQDHFYGINVSIHGIDEGVVAGAPTFKMLANKINGLLNGQVVVTHTHFDKVAIKQACTKYKAKRPSCTWLDSARVVRRTWKEFSQRGYGLQSVCASIGYKFQAHDALEDAKAAGNIMLAAMTQTGFDLDAWLKRVSQPIDPTLKPTLKPTIKPTLKQQIAREGCPDGELYGEVLVFTGALRISRGGAADIAASVGCEVDAGVTKRTTILVVGDQDARQLAGHKKSSKHRKAEELIRKGQSIRILRETDFRELVRLAS